jgi:hypothetical protein
MCALCRRDQRGCTSSDCRRNLRAYESGASDVLMRVRRIADKHSVYAHELTALRDAGEMQRSDALDALIEILDSVDASLAARAEAEHA